MWSVYILECNDGSYYCGICKDIDNRLESHNRGIGSKYTRGRLPVHLLYKIDGLSHSRALQIEYAVKRKSKKDKIDFLRSFIS